MDWEVSCGDSWLHIQNLVKVLHGKDPTIIRSERGNDLILQLKYVNDVSSKEARFDRLWRKILTSFGRIKIEKNEMVIPSVNEINWHDTVDYEYIPNYSFDPDLTGDESNFVSIDRTKCVRQKNCYEPSGYKEVPLSSYILFRTKRELIPSFSVDPLITFFSLRSYIEDKGTNEMRLMYDKMLEVWVPYMNKYGLNKKTNRYFNPTRLKRGAFIRVCTDAYFTKRLSITISYVFFSIIYDHFISINKHAVFFHAFNEIFKMNFYEPYDSISIIKKMIGPITLNAGSIPVSKSRADKTCIYEHCHPIYDVDVINKGREKSNFKTYSKSDMCTDSNCDRSQDVYTIYLSLRKKLIDGVYDLMGRYKMKYLAKAADVIMTENYNENGIRLLIFWNNMQVISGYKASSPIIDITNTINKAKVHRKDFDSTNPIYIEFTESLRHLGKKLMHIQIENNLIYDSIKFRRALPGLMTGKSAGKGSVKLLMKDRSTVVMRDKRSILIGQGMGTLNIRTEDIQTHSDRVYDEGMHCRKIGIRKVPGRQIRAIYQQTLEEFTMETYLFTWINYHMRPAEKVLDEMGDVNNLGTYNIKCRLDSSDEYVCEMVEATGNRGQYVLFMDQDQYDMHERYDNVLKHVFSGMLEEAEKRIPHIISPFTIDDEEVTYVQLLKFYIENCLKRWFVLKHGDHAVQFMVDWLSSGAKFTFDLNSDVNSRLTKLCWKYIQKEFPRVRNFASNIAGDDNYWIMENFECTEKNCKKLLDIIVNVTSSCGFRTNPDKSGLALKAAEYAKILAYAGFLGRIGLMCPFEREDISSADNIIEALRGHYAKLAVFASRHYVDENYSDLMLYINSSQYCLTDDTSYGKNVVMETLMHPRLHGLPASTGLGLGFSYDLMSTDTFQIMLKNDKNKANDYYSYSNNTRPFKMKENIDLEQSAVKMTFGSTTKTVDFGGNLNTIITLDAEDMKTSENAYNSLKRMNISIPDSMAYFKIGDNFKDVILDSAKLSMGAPRTYVNGMKLTTSGRYNIIDASKKYPIFDNLMTKNTFEITDYSESDFDARPIRYPSSSILMNKLQKMLGNREGDKALRVISMFRVIRRAIMNAKLDGVVISPNISEENLAEIIIAVLDKERQMKSGLKNGRKVKRLGKIYYTENGVIDECGNICESMSYITNTKSVLVNLLKTVFGNYSKLQADVDSIMRSMQNIVIGDLCLAVSSGPFLFINTKSKIVFNEGLQQRANYRYYFNLTYLMLFVSIFMMQQKILVPKTLEFNVRGFYSDLVLRSFSGPSLGYE